jgi:molybdopterin molybdotransferase
MITSWLQAHGYHPMAATHLTDDLKGTEEALRDALQHLDVVITAGGVSVGERDFVMKAAQNLGVREVFWRIRQKPGKPLFFGMLNEKPLLGLPGNPGSVFVCLVTHVRRVLDLLERVSSPGPHFHTGRLSEPLELTREREWWVRCRVEFSPEGEAWLIPLPHQSSHMITNLTECTALARLPEGEGVLERGSVVPWTPCAP